MLFSTTGQETTLGPTEDEESPQIVSLMSVERQKFVRIVFITFLIFNRMCMSIFVNNFGLKILDYCPPLDWESDNRGLDNRSFAISFLSKAR